MSLGIEMIKKKNVGEEEEMGVWEKKGKERGQGTVKEGRRKGTNTVEGLASSSLVTAHPSPGVARTVAIRGSCHCPLKALFTF